MSSDFRKELIRLLNAYSKDSESDTPDDILAEYLLDCLRTFNRAVSAREEREGVASGSVIEIEGPVEFYLNGQEQRTMRGSYPAWQIIGMDGKGQDNFALFKRRNAYNQIPYAWLGYERYDLVMVEDGDVFMTEERKS